MLVTSLEVSLLVSFLVNSHIQVFAHSSVLQDTKKVISCFKVPDVNHPTCDKMITEKISASASSHEHDVTGGLEVSACDEQEISFSTRIGREPE